MPRNQFQGIDSPSPCSLAGRGTTTLFDVPARQATLAGGIDFLESRNRCRFRVQRGSVGSALACSKAGPSSNLGLAPRGGFSPLSTSAMRKWREALANGDGLLYFTIVWMWFGMHVLKKDKINKKCGDSHQTLGIDSWAPFTNSPNLGSLPRSKEKHY